jgi:hypothetical protein
MTEKEKEQQAIIEASMKHVLPLVGNHVLAEDLNEALHKIADTAIRVIDELRKPSEDLVKEIYSYLSEKTEIVDRAKFVMATEIAKLLPSSPGGENGVNKELLEALKMIRDDINAGEPASEGFLEHIKIIANSAISNAEKQRKQ